MKKSELMNPFVVMAIVIVAFTYVRFAPTWDVVKAYSGFSTPREATDVRIEFPVARAGDWQAELVSTVSPYSRGDWWGYGFNTPYFKQHMQEPTGCDKGTCVFYPGPAYGEFKNGMGYTGYGPGIYGYDYPSYRPPIYAPPPGAAVPQQALAMKWVGGYNLRLSWVDPTMVRSVKYEVMDQWGNVFQEAVVNQYPFMAILPVPAEATRVRATVDYTSGFSANSYPLPR